jgi:hypothetical protein
MLNIFRKRTFFIMFVILTVLGVVRDTPSCMQLMYTELRKTLEPPNYSIKIVNEELKQTTLASCMQLMYTELRKTLEPPDYSIKIVTEELKQTTLVKCLTIKLAPNETMQTHSSLSHKVNTSLKLPQSNMNVNKENCEQNKAKEMVEKNPIFLRYIT